MGTENSKGKAVALYCADPRFQGEGNPVGVWLTQQGYAGRTFALVDPGVFAAAAWGREELVAEPFMTALSFCIEEGGASEVLILKHRDCHFYHHHFGGSTSSYDEKSQNVTDAVTLERMITDDFSGVTVRIFWMELQGDGTWAFEEVAV